MTDDLRRVVGEVEREMRQAITALAMTPPSHGHRIALRIKPWADRLRAARELPTCQHRYVDDHGVCLTCGYGEFPWDDKKEGTNE